MPYATPTDLVQLGIAAAALSNVSSDAQLAALQAASDDADGYLRSRFRLPLVSWGSDLKMHVCEIAAWKLLKARGFDPVGGADKAVQDGYQDAIRWLEGVAKGLISPGVTDSSPAASPASPRLSSKPPRGWTC